MKTRSLKKIVIRLLVVFLIVTGTATIITWQANLQYNKKIATYPSMTVSPKRVLIVAPHQDDETLFAGGIMIRTMEKKGEVFVLYTVDGVTRNGDMTEQEIAQKRHIREAEVEKALRMIGIDRDHIVFLRNENRKALMNAALLEKAIDKIGDFIERIHPDIIVIPSYEGGHCDHDMTNFAVMTAMNRLRITRIPVYEGPDYTKYMSFRDYVLKMAGCLSFIARRQGPLFVNRPQAVVLRLDLTNNEKTLRQHMLDVYKSQDLDKYKRLHSGDDIYRTVPRYDYSFPPYEYKKTLKYSTCKLFSNDCDNFGVCKVPFSKMRQAMEAVENQ